MSSSIPKMSIAASATEPRDKLTRAPGEDSRQRRTFAALSFPRASESHPQIVAIQVRLT